ncbi:MAG: ROK family protein [Anaerolineaceae bacterium]|jgi:glucokinase|nr:ROK family protein [Anaerolineaceae bacterium]
MHSYITLDIGGTNTRCALYYENSITPLKQIKIITSLDGQATIDRLINIIDEIWPDDNSVCGICAAAPGSINVNNGIVILAPNIPGWKNLELGKIFSARFKVPVFVNNDARMAAIGEWKHGAGVGHKDLMYFTISTGLGNGTIINGRLLEGATGIATESGHITLDDDGPLCGCGKKGHLEAYSSGTGIENFVHEELRKGASSSLPPLPSPSAKQIAEAAKNGDLLAKSAFDRAGYYLGIGIANYLHIFNPSCVIFGGGVSQSGDLLMVPFRKSLESHVMNSDYLNQLEIKIASLGDNVGLIGALEYLKDKLSVFS